MLAGQEIRVELSLNATPLGVKLFVHGTTKVPLEELKELFGTVGKVLRCDKINDYTFVVSTTYNKLINKIFSYDKDIGKKVNNSFQI